MNLKHLTLGLLAFAGFTAQAALAPQYERLRELQFVAAHDYLTLNGDIVESIEALPRGEADYRVVFEKNEGGRCRTDFKIVYGQMPEGMAGAAILENLSVVKTNCRPLREWPLMCRDGNTSYYGHTVSGSAGLRLEFEISRNDKKVGTLFLGEGEYQEKDLGYTETRLTFRDANGKTQSLTCTRPLAGAISIGN